MAPKAKSPADVSHDPVVPYPAHTQSLWFEEALAAEAGDPLEQRPSGGTAADVCIVGGGFAGLWTALELSEQDPSLGITVLEADLCGSGASSRNGGLLSSSWYDLEGLCRTFGEERGLAYATALSDEVSAIGAWCASNGVAAHLRDDGIAYFSGGAFLSPPHVVHAAQVRGVGDRISLWSSQECQRVVRSPRITEAAFTPDAATVQPGLLVRGMRRVALERGIKIVERTPVRKVRSERAPVVETMSGEFRASQVVLTIGAWGTGWRPFRSRLANIADYVVATEPLGDQLDSLGWVSDVGLVGGRQLIYYLRKTIDGRVVIGGGDAAALFGSRIGRNLTANRRVARTAAVGLLDIFPSLAGVRFTHSWGGAIDMSPTYTPFCASYSHGKVHAGLGFSGHGVAASRLAGRILASTVLGRDDELRRLPVAGKPVRRMPPEPLRWIASWLAIRASCSQDLAIEGGGRPSAVARFIASAPDRYRTRRAA